MLPNHIGRRRHTPAAPTPATHKGWLNPLWTAQGMLRAISLRTKVTTTDVRRNPALSVTGVFPPSVAKTIRPDDHAIRKTSVLPDGLGNLRRRLQSPKLLFRLLEIIDLTLTGLSRAKVVDILPRLAGDSYDPCSW